MTEELQKNTETEEDLNSLLERINSERDEGGTTEEIFRIQSDIGRDDYRAFVYYSVALKNKWLLPAYIVLPLLVAGSFAYANGVLNILLALGIAGILYAVIAGMTVFRTERSLSKSNKENPDLMRLTPTSFRFLGGAVINSKKGADIRVPYKNLEKVCETKQRFILYFAGKKAMILRKEDVARDAGIEKFRSFITSKINK